MVHLQHILSLYLIHQDSRFQDLSFIGFDEDTDPFSRFPFSDFPLLPK